MTDGTSRNDPTTKTASAVKRAHASHRPKWQRFQNPPPPPPPRPSENNGGGTGAATGGTPATALNPYNRQYSHIYARRLEALKPFCLSAAAKAEAENDDGKRKNVVVVTNRIIELKENVVSVVAGTVVKDVANRPSVDDDDSPVVASSDASSGLADDAEPLRSYCDPDGNDSIVLEDDSGRIELVPSPNVDTGGEGSASKKRRLDKGRLVTGMVVAARGTVRPDTGVMEVEEVYLPDPPPRGEPDVENVEATGASSVDGNDKGLEGQDAGPCVVLLSGLHCGADEDGASLSLRRDMLLSYLAGRCGASAGARVCRAVVAGGGCAAPSTSKPTLEDKGGRRRVDDDPSLPVKELDLYLSELVASGIPVDYLPGRHDPTDANWPQRPLHPCLLPNATTFGGGERGEMMLRRCPNPYESNVGGRTFLGTDGTNLVDLRRYVVSSSSSAPEDETTTTEGDDDDDREAANAGPTPCTEMEALALTLRCRHLCPTGPDSLPTFPCAEFDPFVVEDAPDVYFAGNCDSFDSEEMTTTKGRRGRLICVPSFAKTGEVVLVNLKTLDCEVLKFDERVE